jgi:glycosyltransferase involved in cell wall biosynthesis
MSKRIEGYLAKRAVVHTHRVEGASVPAKLERVVVIPAIAEHDNLPHTLDSLSQCSPDQLTTTLLLIVINNRSVEHVSADVIDENQRTLDWLRATPYPTLNLAYIDASSPGLELARKDGVGMARKIGMDHALQILHQSNAQHPLIICLDADSIIEPNYLDTLDTFACSDSPWAAVIDYAHPLDGTPPEREAIVSYELFLRYMELSLRYAASPYAFHTIGSTIACTPEAYAAVSGMNRRAAGEDFYFLQQLAKTGTVEHIRDTTVYPSPRISWRVPFGTGKRVGRFLDGNDTEWQVYNPDSYRILRDWFTYVESSPWNAGNILLNLAQSVAPELAEFLDELGFEDAWTKLQAQSSNNLQLLKQFHSYFDSFQTLKLIHHLRDNGFPDINTIEAFEILNKRAGLGLTIQSNTHNDLDAQVDLLNQLRALR